MKDLRSFLQDVREKMPGDLVTVKKEVSPDQELCGVLRKLQEKNLFPAVYFEKVTGTKVPVVSNVLASRTRLALALETSPGNLSLEYAKREDDLKDPVHVTDAPVKQNKMVGDEVDFSKFPNIIHCNGDGGAYIASGVCLLKDPDTGITNAGMYRLQVKAKNKLGLNTLQSTHGDLILRKAEARKKSLGIAIVIGHHPLVYLASQYRGPLETSELRVAGGLMGEPLRVVSGETVDMDVPADSEIVIEGQVPPGVWESEGPFGEYTWYMSGVDPARVINITAITYRDNPIYQDLFSAHPEHSLTGLVGREAIVYKRVKAAIPTLKALTLPFSGCCRHTVYLSISKEYDGLGKNAGLAALNADPYMKMAIVVDDDIDVFNEAEVMWAATTRVQPDKDVICIPETYLGGSDPSSYSPKSRTEAGHLNARWLIDATTPDGMKLPPRSEVSEDVWKKINLDDYIKG
jgi:2,5-furandicarboxylate decarboxylase 1